ncbi:permease [Marinospirillum sp.]|uniref:permease n=1 Tax=Marinospirillum sp. TaxID=2183934 RepID=UPI0028706F76|nr:permease [Marinospirillum sp.]MDR9468709.1 permease [Marinospirillum sp.]
MPPDTGKPSFIKLLQDNRGQLRLLALMTGIFLLIFFLPVEEERVSNAFLEGVQLTHWYAREHVILCLLPAFLIAGALATYMSEGAVMRYLGPDAPKPVAFSVASVSGTLLAVCSCTVLPLFGGIYKRGAGLGAAVAFLYSGPAINVMAVVVTAKVLGAEIGIARAVGAIIFALVIGTIMHVIYRKEESQRGEKSRRGFGGGSDSDKPMGIIALFFALLVGILVFANWAAADSPAWMQIYAWKWPITGLLSAALAVLLIWRWHWPANQLLLLAAAIAVAAWAVPAAPELPFVIGIGGLMLIASLRDEDRDWTAQSWDFAKQILPLLLAGVFVAGFALGRPGQEGVIPSQWVAQAVGDNSFRSTLIASFLGALMYFSTLTEVPIVEALMGSGMGKGPALALLLAGPALSLPNMLVIRTILGTQKTLVYCGLVVVMATTSGFIYGNWV